jgi:hypothetical protein
LGTLNFFQKMTNYNENYTLLYNDLMFKPIGGGCYCSFEGYCECDPVYGEQSIINVRVVGNPVNTVPEHATYSIRVFNISCSGTELDFDENDIYEDDVPVCDFTVTNTMSKEHDKTYKKFINDFLNYDDFIRRCLNKKKFKGQKSQKSYIGACNRIIDCIRLKNSPDCEQQENAHVSMRKTKKKDK